MKNNPKLIPTEIIASVTRSDLSPTQVGREFTKLIKGGAKIHVAGEAKNDPHILFGKGHRPKHKNRTL